MKKFRNFAVSIIAMIGVVNTLGYTYILSKEKDIVSEKKVSTVEETIKNTETKKENIKESIKFEAGDSIKKSDVSKKINEIQSIAKKEKTKLEAEVTTVDSSAAKTKSESEKTTVDSSSNELNKKYEIKPVANLINKEISSLQSFTVDLDDNAIYYLDYKYNDKTEDLCYYIYKYDIQKDSIEEVSIISDTKEESPIYLTYNQFDKQVYCFTGYQDHQYAYYQLMADEMIVFLKNDIQSYNNNFKYCLYDSFYFIDEKELVFKKRCNIGRTYPVYSYNENNNTILEGYIENVGKENNRTQIPFIYNENYYWADFGESSMSVVETDKLFYPPNTGEHCGKVLKEYSLEKNGWRGLNIYNNEVYLMTKDFSFYKVNIDKLGKIYENESQFKQNEELELVIDGSEIKQTGKNNLSTVKYFYFTSDREVVVYDEFDSTYKLISPIK